MMLFQMENGYRYNSDTLLLYDFISSFKPSGELLDVGCGCGILGLLLKRDFPCVNLTCIDIQPHNGEITQANALHNSIEIKNIIIEDILEVSFSQKFDYVVSNPPFYHPGSQKSDNLSLSISRHSSHLPFEKLAQKASKILSNKGYFIFCYDAKQCDMLTNALSENGLKIEDMCFVHVKKDKEASLVLVRARKNSKTLCTVHPPLFVYEEGAFSPYVQSLFERSQTKSLPWNT